MISPSAEDNAHHRLLDGTQATHGFSRGTGPRGRNYVILLDSRAWAVSDWEGGVSGMSFDSKPGTTLQPHSSTLCRSAGLAGSWYQVRF
jgi:hypothetical protein